MFLTSETGNDIIASYDYFPYGKKIELAHTSEGAVTQTFTGKELDRYDEDLDIGADGEGWYYFGARYYDADIGMWASCDPKAQFWSLYSYTGNGINPIVGIDPDGLDITWYTRPVINSAVGQHMFAIVTNKEGQQIYLSLKGSTQGSHGKNGMPAISHVGQVNNGAWDKDVSAINDGSAKAFWWEGGHDNDNAYISAFNKNFEAQKNNYPSALQHAWTRIVNFFTGSNDYGIGENSNTIQSRAASDIGIIIPEVDGAVNQNQ